ncbi:polyphosphate polymerase domain-containing protein [Myxococcota bacterium]|nr:polyphosphate polymerase domain-containing protein [Myxococcota bacterium]
MIRRFNRYELKYVVTTAERDALLPTMLAHMGTDKEGSDEGIYQVTSLYYDTWDLACYRAKLDGINYRRKLRIRRYGRIAKGENPKVMVEIKQRINRTTQKRRVSLPLDEAYELCDGHADLDAFTHPLDRAVAEEVTFLACARQLSPKCVVGYRRRALVGSIYEPGLRVTFDEDLRVSAPAWGLDEGATEHSFLPWDRAILEIKTNDVLPVWLPRLLAAHGITVKRFSKYCTGIAKLRGLDRHDELLPPSGEWTHG